jgi:hypothetical protein
MPVLLQNGTMRIPLEAIEFGQYQIVLTAKDKQGNVIATAEQTNVLYHIEQPPFFMRLIQGVSGNWLAMFVIMLFMTGLAVFLVRSLHKSPSTYEPGQMPPSRAKKSGPRSRQNIPRSVLEIGYDNRREMAVVTHVPYVLGRGSRASKQIDKDSVSTSHAQISFYQSAFYIRDLGSLNGTFLNGDKLSPNSDVLLDNGDTIELGQSVTIKFVLGD